MHSPKRNTSSTSWGPVADWYEGHLASGDTYHERVILPNLLRLLGDVKGKKVLDLACGTGYFSKKIAEAGASVTGTDVSPELIAKAKQNLLGYPTSKFVVTPAHDLHELKHVSFDAIINVLAVDNIAEVPGLLRESARLLKNGGAMHIVFNHPVVRIPGASSWGFDQKRGVQYRRLDKYMSESKVKIAMHPGLNSQSTTTFHRSLQYYFNKFREAGFVVANLEEWVSDKVSEPGPRQKPEDQSRKEFPLFLYLQLRK